MGRTPCAGESPIKMLRDFLEALQGIRAPLIAPVTYRSKCIISNSRIFKNNLIFSVRSIICFGIKLSLKNHRDILNNNQVL